MQRSSAIAPPEHAGLHPPRPLTRPPVVERIAGWSARHRKTAVLGWLFLVAAVFVGGQMLPAKNIQPYDAGQSGQAQQTLNRLGVTSPPAETVLIRARAPGRTFAVDPELRQATQQVDRKSVM